MTGDYLGELYPRRDFYYDSQQSMTIPGVRSSLEDDFYVLLVDWQQVPQQGATFKIYHNPLVNFAWLGGLVVHPGYAGGRLAGCRDRERRGRAPARTAQVQA